MKPPSSHEVEKNNYLNYQNLRPSDEIKIVINDVSDYEWAKRMDMIYDISNRCFALLLSPAFDKMPFDTLAELIKKDNFNARLNLQVHKIIWGKDAESV